MKRVLFLFLVMCLFVSALPAGSLTEIWESGGVLKTVESVNYDAERNMLYASCINGGPAVRDGNGFIAKLKPDGTIVQLKWVTGLNAPKGAAISGESLYVSDIDVLVKINIPSGKIIARFPAPGAQFLNDVAVGPGDAVFVSDSSSVSMVYKLKGKVLVPWFHDRKVPAPNGLASDGKSLFVGSFQTGVIAAVSFSDCSMRVVACSRFGVDGLIPLGGGRFLTSDWQGHIGIAGPGTRYVLLFDGRDNGINAADLGFIQSKGLLLVPTFFHNTVAAYKINVQ